MANSIASKVQAHLDRQAEVRRREIVGWTAPQLESPLLIDARSLTPLGEIKGRPWFDEKSVGELEEQGGLLSDRDILPSTVLVQTRDEDGQRAYRSFRIHAPGTYERLAGQVAPPPPRAPKAAGLIDGLGGIGLFTRVTGDMRPSYRIRGVEQILARLGSKGVAVRLTADRSALVMVAGDGRPAYTDAVVAATPLLLPYLQSGALPTCQVTAHPTPVEAITVALPGTAWCGSCEA